MRYRCTLFPQLVSLYEGDSYSAIIAESNSPESAMYSAMCCCLDQHDDNEWIKTDLTWQPSSGLVYSLGEQCGVVFKIS